MIPGPPDIYEVGVRAGVLQMLKLPDGTVKVLVEGAAARALLKLTDREAYYEAEIADIDDEAATPTRPRPSRARWSSSSKAT